MHLLFFIWDFFQFDDNNCFVRYSMIAFFYFSSFSNHKILSFEMLTINLDKSFVIYLASFPVLIVSSSKQSFLSTSTWNFLKIFISFNILSWFIFVSSCVDFCKLVYPWYGKKRVTSWKLKNTNWEFKSMSWNSKMPVQIHELRVQIHGLRI